MFEETRSPRFELTRHFLASFFDSEFVSTPGQLRVLASGAIAVLLSSGILFTVGYYHKYLILNELDTAEPLRLAGMADVLFLACFAMIVSGIVTVLEWTALFPGRRDYLALAGLPLRARDLFLARFAAVALFAASVVLATTTPLSIVLPLLQEGRHQHQTCLHIWALFAAISLGAFFVFFSLTALEGLLLNLVPPRRFDRFSLPLQAALLAVLLCGFPLAFLIPNLHQSMTLRPEWAPWAPPLWFLGLHQAIMGSRDPLALQLASLALRGTGAALALVMTMYLWSYRRHARQLESSTPPGEPAGWARFEAAAERLIPDPRRLAVFSFIAHTLMRSRQHQLMLSAYLALALAFIVDGFATHTMGFRQAAVAAPLTLSLFLLAGLRYLFRLPVNLGANWVFQLNEGGHRSQLLAGVERFLVYTALAPLAVVALAAETTLLGPVTGIQAAVLTGMPALILAELVLVQQVTIPFTCSYLPGRRPVVQTLLLYGVAVVLYVTGLSGLISGSLEMAAATVGLFAAFAAILWRIRHARLEHWEVGRIEFEERPEAAVQVLAIYRD